jgi:4-hydroxy-tetrahydrodipicolinate synthase
VSALERGPGAIPRPGGIVCPLATPLTPGGRLDEAVLRAHVEALVPDLDGLFVLGSSGELPWLTDDVALATAAAAIDQVDGRIPVYLGIGDNGEHRTLQRMDRLAGLGADFLVLATPTYYPVASAGHLSASFERIADRAPKPIVLYNIPQNTHLPLTPAIVRDLAGHPDIVGIKDSSGDLFAFGDLLELRADGFSVLQGREQLAAVSLWSGADGIISGLANLAPRLLGALARAIRDDRPRAEVHALQAEVTALAGVFGGGDWLAGLKRTLGELGWNVGDPSPPMAPSGPDASEAIGRILDATDPRWLTRSGVA